MLKLKDLIDGASSAPKRVDEALAINEREPNPAQNAAGLKNALSLLRKDIIQAMGKSLDLGNSGYQMAEITRTLAKANKLLNNLQRKMKTSEGASMNEGPAMTDQEKKRTKSRLHKFDRPKLTQMLRQAADAANRGNARADDLAHIYRDELNDRAKEYDGV